MIVLLNNWWWCCCWCLWYLCCFIEHDLRHILKSPPATFWYCQRRPERNSNQPLLLMIIIDIERERAYFLLSLCIIIKKIMMGPGWWGRTPRWHPELHGNSWWNVNGDRVADNPLILMMMVMLMTLTKMTAMLTTETLQWWFWIFPGPPCPRSEASLPWTSQSSSPLIMAFSSSSSL